MDRPCWVNMRCDCAQAMNTLQLNSGPPSVPTAESRSTIEQPGDVLPRDSAASEDIRAFMQDVIGRRHTFDAIDRSIGDEDHAPYLLICVASGKAARRSFLRWRTASRAWMYNRYTRP